MAMESGLMQGKRGVILGVANNRSIAFGIAKACRAAGAEIALTNPGGVRSDILGGEGGAVVGMDEVEEPLQPLDLPKRLAGEHARQRRRRGAEVRLRREFQRRLART